MTAATGRIRVIKIPEGEAPLWVRRAWVGLTLPCDPFCGYPDNCGHLEEAGLETKLEYGVLTGTPAKANRYGFSVPQDEAIHILSEKSPQAAAWWNDHGFPQPGGYFGFDESEAKIISGVTLQNVEHWDEMETGRPESPWRR